jgi:hypothetical protein
VRYSQKAFVKNLLTFNHSSSFSKPIYTLLLPGAQVYIVNSPHLVAAVDRNAKHISFAPYVVQFAKRILIPSLEGLDALAANIKEDDGAWGCRPETLEVMHAALVPGEDLNRTTRALLESIDKFLSSDDISPDSHTQPIQLFSWVRRLVTIASTDAIYGSKANPFLDPKVEAGFW